MNGINTPFVVRLDPPAVSLSDQPAGPLLAPPGIPRDPHETAAQKAEREKFERSLGVMTKRRYRPLEILVYPRNGRLHFELPPRVVEGMTHGRVIHHEEFDNNFLDIDWKPDWITVRPDKRRDKEPIFTVDGGDPTKQETASDFLTAGKWAIVIHRTAENEIGSSLNHFIENWDDKGAHYLIDLDGHAVKLIDDRVYMAHHAGPGAQWQNKRPVNAFSIGIEIVNKTGRQYAHAQMASLILLLDRLRKTFRIPKDRVLAHAEIRRIEGEGKTLNNPKEPCPGFEFEWTILEKNGHATFPSFREDARLPPGFDEFFLNNADDGLMFPNNDKGKGHYGKKNRPLDSGRNDLVAQLHRNLVAIGYERPQSPNGEGEFSAYTEKIVRRFQARYMTGVREKYLGEEREHLGKATIHTIVMMQAVLTARGQEWRTV
jgi:N-acetyl-anhydromuramyl-L-alanine amidase AmpD